MPRESACVPPPSSYKSRGQPNIIKDVIHAIEKQNTRPPQLRFSPSSSKRTTFTPFKCGGFRDEDDYFDRDDDEDEPNEAQTDNNGDNTQNSPTSTKRPLEDDEEDDPLDAFMRTLDEDAKMNTKKDLKSKDFSCLKKESKHFKASPSAITNIKACGVRVDIDDMDDDEESYYRHIAENAKSTNNSCKTEEEQAEEEDRMNSIEYDKDGNPIVSFKLKKEIDPLPPIDHSQIDYSNFEKCYYEEHEDIKRLSNEQTNELRAKLEIRVSGVDPPKPICSFAHFGFDEQLMRVIRKSEYSQPTPIQAQAVPAALSGRNIIGIAMTGSGKTAAYLWPMIVHIMGQSDLRKGDGPIGLILVPTRELALQVYGEVKKFASTYNIATICAYGGGSKYEQSRDFEAGAEVVVATPGRMIDMIKMKVTNLRRVTYLVLDEADRMFDMGFEPQVRSLCDHVRPDRQILMFSATFKKKIERLARHVIVDPIKIVQKELGEANEDVAQHVIVLPSGPARWEWLLARIVEFLSCGSILIFATRKDNASELHQNLEANNHECLLLHGDLEQSARNRVITAFKKKELPILVATDIAARGLDIPHIRTVINFDVARDIDTHVHRIGRTGRAGTKGDAYTLVTEKDKEFAGHLVRNLESCNQKVSSALMELAMKSNWFRKSRFKGNQKRFTPSNSFNQARWSGLGYKNRSRPDTSSEK